MLVSLTLVYWLFTIFVPIPRNEAMGAPGSTEKCLGLPGFILILAYPTLHSGKQCQEGKSNVEKRELCTRSHSLQECRGVRTISVQITRLQLVLSLKGVNIGFWCTSYGVSILQKKKYLREILENPVQLIQFSASISPVNTSDILSRVKKKVEPCPGWSPLGV